MQQGWSRWELNALPAELIKLIELASYHKKLSVSLRYTALRPYTLYR